MNKIVIFGIFLAFIGGILFWCTPITPGTALAIWSAGAFVCLGGFIKEAVEKRNCF